MKPRGVLRWGVAPALALVLLSALSILVRKVSPQRMALREGWTGPNAPHPLGTGEGGIDLLAFVAHAIFRSWLLAAGVCSVAFCIGTLAGMSSALGRGRLARSLPSICDLAQSFPTFLLALGVMAVVRVPSRAHIAFVFSVSAWAPFARLAFAQARILCSAHFVEASRALGASSLRVLFRHLLPNLLGPQWAQLGTSMAGVVLGEAALGFVGLGPSDGVSLGALLEQGIASMLQAPHVLLTGAVAVALLSGSLQLATDSMQRE